MFNQKNMHNEFVYFFFTQLFRLPISSVINFKESCYTFGVCNIEVYVNFLIRTAIFKRFKCDGYKFLAIFLAFITHLGFVAYAYYFDVIN